jgi:nucleotide-binding universal stress UspA family protein
MGSLADGQSGLAQGLWGGRKENDMGRSIVCGVDGSADSQAALGVAASLAERLGARLVLAHVAELALVPYAAVDGIGAGGIAPQPMLPAMPAGQEEAGTRLLEQIAVELGLQDAEQRVVVGFPAERLADLADEEGAELIVVGSRGRGRFKAAFLGSVSNSLVGVARCPVLIVPPGATAAQ